MKFILTATSNLSKFLDKIQEEFNISTEVFTHTEYMRSPHKTVEEYNRSTSNMHFTWESLGVNHRLSETGVPMRDFESNEYVIELNDLQDMLKLKEICDKELVIDNLTCYDNYPLAIEIYDD